MNNSAVLDFIGVLRLAAVALAITAGLGLIASWLGGHVFPILRFGMATMFLPWIAGAVLGAVWMTVLRSLVRRSRFLSDTA